MCQYCVLPWEISVIKRDSTNKSSIFHVRIGQLASSLLNFALMDGLSTKFRENLNAVFDNRPIYLPEIIENVQIELS